MNSKKSKEKTTIFSTPYVFIRSFCHRYSSMLMLARDDQSWTPYMKKLIIFSFLITSLTSCGGDLLDELLDIKIEQFDLNRENLYPGEEVTMEWEVSDALSFSAEFYLSEDRSLSRQEDQRIISEDCSFIDDGDVCEANQKIEFLCEYGENNNRFDCFVDDEDRDTQISANDISEFLQAGSGIPKQAYIIFEACDGSDCETSSEPIVFY